MRRRSLPALLAATAAVFVLAAPASADTFTFTAPYTGYAHAWNDPSSWTDTSGGTDADGIPDADDDVVISPNGGWPAIDLGVFPIDVHDFTVDYDPSLGGEVELDGAPGTTLTVHGSGRLESLSVSGPTLHLAGADNSAYSDLATWSAPVEVDDGATLSLGTSPDGMTSSVVMGNPSGVHVNDGGTVNVTGAIGGLNNRTAIDVGTGGTLNLSDAYVDRAGITSQPSSTITMHGANGLVYERLTVGGALDVFDSPQLQDLTVASTGRVTLHQAAGGSLPQMMGWNGGTVTFDSGSVLALDRVPGQDIVAGPWYSGGPPYLIYDGFLNFNGTVTGLRTSPSATYRSVAIAGILYLEASALTTTTAPALDHAGAQVPGTTLTCSPGTYSNPRDAASSIEFLRDGASAGTGATYAITSADRGHTLTCVDHATDSDANVLDAASSNSATVPELPLASLGAHPSGALQALTDTEFTGADHYRCAVDGATAVACTSPYRPAGLADGQHTVVVTGYNAQDEPESAPHTVAFTLDRVAPAITATAPSDLVAPASAAITVGTDEAGATVTCDLDGVPVTPCAPRATVSLRAAGTYQFTVKATDAAGNRATKTIALAVAKAPDAVQTDPVQPTLVKPDPVKPVVKPTTMALPNITDPAAPATCPAIPSLEQTGASWLDAGGTSSTTLSAGSAAGIWRCVIRGTENGAPVEYRSLPVLVTAGQRAMLTAQSVSATAAKLTNPRLLSTGHQRISARLYRRVAGTWKLGPRSTSFTQNVTRGTNTIALTRHLSRPLPKGRYKLVVRVYTGRHTLSDPLTQSLTVA